MKTHLRLFQFCLFVAATVLLWSCLYPGCDSPKLPYQVLTDNIKPWFPYTREQDLVFENDLLLTDTIRLRDVFIGDDEIWRGDECPSGNGQFIRGHFIDYTSDDTISSEMGFQHIFATNSKIIFVSYNDKIKGIGIPTPYRKFEESVVLNGKLFRDCISVECTAADNCNPLGITKYYFSKSIGLAAYVRNGILWTLK